MQSFNKIGSWILRLVAAAIMLQTLYFKFSASEESVYIFSKIGMEPWGRLGTGALELIASILLLINRTVLYGALLGIALMSGAIFFHLNSLGLIVKDDGGLLFTYACIVLICCLILAIMHRKIIKNRDKDFL